MGLGHFEFTWDAATDSGVFARRLGERLGVAIAIETTRFAPPTEPLPPKILEARAAIDTAIRITSPLRLRLDIESIEWGPSRGRVLTSFDSTGYAVGGAVMLTLIDLGARYDGKPRPSWQGTLAEIHARHSLRARLRRWFRREQLD